MRIVQTHPSDNRIKLRAYRTRRSWCVRVQVKGGPQRLVTLRASPSDDVGALVEGRTALALAAQGIDPHAHRDQHDAEQKARHEKQSARATTFAEAVETFLASPDVAELRQRSRNDLVWALQSSHVRHLQQKRLADISKAAIEGVLTKLKAKPSTARKVGGAIRRLMRYGAGHDWVGNIPVVKLPAPRARPEPLIAVGERADWSELVAVLDAIDALAARYPGSLYPPLWTVQMLTGLRPECVERLAWDDVNLSKRTIRIRAEVSKLRRELVVPISQAAADVLKGVRESKFDLWTTAQRASTLVFPGRTGKPLSKNEPLVAFVDGMTGRAHFRPQRFRSTFITYCEWRGIPYAQVARLVDWRAEGRLANYSVQGVNESDRAIVEQWAADVESARRHPAKPRLRSVR